MNHITKLQSVIAYKEQQLNELYYRKVDDQSMMILLGEIRLLKMEIESYRNLYYKLGLIKLERENNTIIGGDLT